MFKRFRQAIYEALPVKTKVYFLYTHKNGFERFRNGLKANTEISFWCYDALKRAFPRVCFLKFQGEKKERIEEITQNDVVIGHPGETFHLASEKTKRLISFGPWVGHEDHSKEAFNCAPKEYEMAFYDKAKTLILLTSEFNKKTYLEKETNFWYPYFQNVKKIKSVRIVHQPIDLALFKRIKWEYLTGDFLYIGNQGHMKCIETSMDLVKEVNRRLHLYGVGTRKVDHLNPKQVNALPFMADFFIQPGMWEAQCVSILEAAARGFIPVVSRDTGYPYDHPFLLKYGDFDYNLNILKNLLKTTPQERKNLADHLHSQLVNDVNHNNWKQLTDVLVEEVKKLMPL